MKFQAAMLDKVQDSITGAVGTVVGKIEYLSGEIQYLIAWFAVKDGVPVEPTWLLADRCKTPDNIEGAG